MLLVAQKGNHFPVACLVLAGLMIGIISAAPVTDRNPNAASFAVSLSAPKLEALSAALIMSGEATDDGGDSSADQTDELSVRVQNAGGAGGNTNRGVISDIAKVVKIAEIIGTVGETVIPALVEGTQTQKSLIATAEESAAGNWVHDSIGQRLRNAFKAPGAAGGAGGAMADEPTTTTAAATSDA